MGNAGELRALDITIEAFSGGNATLTTRNISSGSNVNIGNVTGNWLIGNGSRLIPATGGYVYANSSNSATYAGFITGSSQPNITTVGTLGNIVVSGNTTTKYFKSTVLVTGNIGSASTLGAGTRAFVSDATSTTFAAAYTGGGANNVPVYSDGSAWRIG
jgi:hypothetical protein